MHTIKASTRQASDTTECLGGKPCSLEAHELPTAVIVQTVHEHCQPQHQHHLMRHHGKDYTHTHEVLCSRKWHAIADAVIRCSVEQLQLYPAHDKQQMHFCWEPDSV
jgi:hypothetical protein